MSHLITGLSVSPEPILDKSPLREIVAPKYKHVLKEQTLKNSKHYENWKQEIAIAKLCKKLTDREFSILRKQNATEIQHHFARLKSKIRRHVSPNSPSVAKFFENDGESTSLNVKSLLQKMPQKISLATRYNPKLIALAESINDVRQINNEKENYVQWLDHQNNSSIKSPNYCRMSFVLERLANAKRYSGMGSDLCGKQESLCKIGHKKDHGNSVLVYRKQDDYKPKAKRIKTQAHDISCVIK